MKNDKGYVPFYHMFLQPTYIYSAQMQCLPNKLEVFVLLNIPKNLGEAHFWGRLQQP